MVLLGVFGSTAVAAEPSVSLSRRDCARLVRHATSADVTFRPGVDVRGRPVRRADLAGSQHVTPPDRIEFPIAIDLGERLGIPPAGDADYIARIPVGTVSLTAEGGVIFNGVTLTDAETADLAARCQRRDAAR